MAETTISAAQAAALGDVRSMRSGDVIWLDASAPDRRDFTRYLDASLVAVARGAELRWKREE